MLAPLAPVATNLTVLVPSVNGTTTDAKPHDAQDKVAGKDNWAVSSCPFTRSCSGLLPPDNAYRKDAWAGPPLQLGTDHSM